MFGRVDRGPRGFGWWLVAALVLALAPPRPLWAAPPPAATGTAGEPGPAAPAWQTRCDTTTVTATTGGRTITVPVSAGTTSAPSVATGPLPASEPATVAGIELRHFRTEALDVFYRDDVPAADVRQIVAALDEAAGRVREAVQGPPLGERVPLYLFCTSADLADGASALRGERVETEETITLPDTGAGAASVIVVGGSGMASVGRSNTVPIQPAGPSTITTHTSTFSFTAGQRPGIYVSAAALAYQRGRWVGSAIALYTPQYLHRLAARAPGGLDAAPAWFRHGLAANIRPAAAAAGDDLPRDYPRRAWYEAMAQAQVRQGVVPLSRLATEAQWAEQQRRRPDATLGSARGGAAMQAALAVHRLVERAGLPAVFGVLSAAVAGTPFEAAFRSTFGLSVTEYEAALLADYPPLPYVAMPAVGRLATTFSFVAGGFRPGETVSWTYELSDGDSYTPAFSRQSRADADGVVTVSEGAIRTFGRHELRLRGDRGTRVAVPFHVLAPGETPGETSGVPAGATLARRGLHALESQFYTEVDSARLHAAAAKAVNVELARLGQAPRLPALAFEGDSAANADRFEAAFRQLVRELAAGGPGHAGEQALAHAAVSGAAAALGDCHTRFVTAEQRRFSRQLLAGIARQEGIGVVVEPGRDGYPIIREVYRDGPADQADLRRGDTIRRIDGGDVRGRPPAEIARLLAGTPGSAVALTVRRWDEPAPLEVSVRRASVPIPAYAESQFGNGVEHLRVAHFTEALDYRAAFELQQGWSKRRPRGLVVDLRDNAGGRSTAMASLIGVLGRGETSYTFVGRSGAAGGGSAFYSSGAAGRRFPIAVLVNERSASAAEITAAVLQESGSARLFGARTAGCFNARIDHGLGDGHGVYVTTHRTLTARGRNYEGTGVTPNVVVEQTIDDVAEGYDPQLSAALDWIAAQNTALPPDGATSAGALVAPGWAPLWFGRQR